MPVVPAGRVTLRRFAEQDVDLVLAVADDPLIPLVTTIPTSGTVPDALAWVHRQHRRLTDGQGCSFAIAETETDRAVGQIGLWTDQISYGRASIGYWVAAPYRGHGYATAALRGLVSWAFRLTEVERLELHVEPSNEGSWRTAETCGFVREGLLRSWQRVGDRRRDFYVYGLVR